MKSYQHFYSPIICFPTIFLSKNVRFQKVQLSLSIRSIFSGEEYGEEEQYDDDEEIEEEAEDDK